MSTVTLLPTERLAQPDPTPDRQPPAMTTEPSEYPVGRIVYTCQLFKDNNRNQLCLMDADGSNQRRLTHDDNVNSWYGSFGPDGKSIVFSSNQTGSHEIYEMDLDGKQKRLTSIGELYAPEISPNGRFIVFTNANGTYSSIWIMRRNGTRPHAVYTPTADDALDPTWSPDGKQILFALGRGDDKRLFTINPDGSDLSELNDVFTTRGRTDWSPDGRRIVGYTGPSWKRRLLIMDSTGSELAELYAKGNAQGPTFSPDSGWVAFTGYLDAMGDEDGCEIYVLKLTEPDPQRLTNNDHCDWQPRWGP